MAKRAIHDSLVKAIFRRPVHAEGLFRAILPAPLVAQLDFSTLERIPGSGVDKLFREKHTDLLFTVRTRDHREALVHLLFEHRSRVSRWLPLDLLSYTTRILEWYREVHPEKRRLPLVIPVALVHDPRARQMLRTLDDLTDADQRLLEARGQSGLRFGIFVDDLRGLDSEVLLTRAMTAAGRVTLLALKHARTAGEIGAILRRASGLIREILESDRGRGLFALIMRYIILAATDADPVTLARIVSQEIDEQAGEIVMSVGEKLREQGRAEGLARGREEGRAQGWVEGLAEGWVEGLAEGRVEGLAEGRVEGLAEGRVEGHREILRQLLEARFGALSPDIARRIDAAPIESLQRWGRSLLTAKTLGDVFTE
ncbi:MAG: Rpn family recombination-promoting nuclease/putative transposase [Planctomycetota bacterium]